MVGASASASAVVPSIFSVGLSAAGLSSTGLSITGFSGGGILSSTCFGGGGSTGSTRGNGGGSGAGLGSAATEPGGLAPEPEPGINEKSSANEDEIHGTCSLRDARVTPTPVRFTVSSAIKPATPISFTTSSPNRPGLGGRRYHKGRAAGLDAEGAEGNQRDGAGLDAPVELVESPAHRFAGQVLPDLDTESVALEFVGDLAGVVDGLLERRFGVGIFGVADHKRKPVGAVVRRHRRDQRRDRHRHDRKQSDVDFHKTQSAQPTRRRYQLAPRRPYSTQTPLSNRAHEPSTACEAAFNCAN